MLEDKYQNLGLSFIRKFWVMTFKMTIVPENAKILNYWTKFSVL